MKKYFKLLSAVVISLFFSQVAYAAHINAANDVVDVAMHTKNLSTLVTAIKAAGLVDTLKGAGPFTVFAPTNVAFAKLPKGTLENLLKDKAKLTAVLTYHVVLGKLTAKDIENGPVATVQGATVLLNKTGSGVTVNNAKVVKADRVASNGVIHEIDTVLMPSAAPANS